MKRIFAAVAALLFLLSSLTGCAAAKPDVPLTAILDEIVATVPVVDGSRMSKDDLLSLYGIQTADVAEQSCLSAMNGIFPDEIVMVKATDSAACKRIREKLENRLNEVLNQSKSYDPESYAIAQKCKVDERGLYLALFVSAKHEDMTVIYDAHF